MNFNSQRRNHRFQSSSPKSGTEMCIGVYNMSGQGKVYFPGFDLLPAVLHQGIGRPTSRQGDGNEDDPATNFQEDREKCKIEAEVRALNWQWGLGWLDTGEARP